MKYAIQMYSVRDGIKHGDDMLKALEDVKNAGYEGVEFAEKPVALRRVGA